MKKRIRVWDATHNTRKTMWRFLDCLKAYFEFEETPDNPDYVFSCNMDRYLLNYTGVRIWLTGENLIPDFNIVDYAIGFNDIAFSDRYLRWPLYRWSISPQACEEQRRRSIELSPAHQRKKFCACVISNLSNRQGPLAEICDALDRDQGVTYGGKWRNNIGGRVKDKLGLLREHKFSIAFENTAYPGYTTEKIVDAFLAGTIPVYWGDPAITRHFNAKAFVECTEGGVEEAVQRMKAVHESAESYEDMLKQPIFTSQALDDLEEERLISFLHNIFNQPLAQAYRRNRSRWGIKYETTLRRTYFNPLSHMFRLPKIWSLHRRGGLND